MPIGKALVKTPMASPAELNPAAIPKKKGSEKRGIYTQISDGPPLQEAHRYNNVHEMENSPSLWDVWPMKNTPKNTGESKTVVQQWGDEHLNCRTQNTALR